MRASHIYYYYGNKGIPQSADALFHLNGVIEQDGNDYYFSDKSGNGRRFLITNKDFPSGWTVGFPYKSKATISAPAEDATLIAADINNYLYDSEGTPNEIPVVSLFQDIDYEHKLFCRHRSQVLGPDDEEIIEPRIAEIVMYNEVRTGDGLTACQSYFGVPDEATSNVKWVSKDGDNSNDGSKASPWLTLNKANTSATAGDIIYVESGDYLENHTGTTGYWQITKSLTYIGVGRVNVTSVNTNFASSINSAVTLSLKNIVIGNSVASANAVINMGAFASNLTFDRCWIKSGVIGISAASALSLTAADSVFTGISGTGSRVLSIGVTNLTLQGCYYDGSVVLYNNSSSSGEHTINLKYNRLPVTTLVNGAQVNLTVECNSLQSLTASITSNEVSAETRLRIQKNSISNPSGTSHVVLNSNFTNCEITHNEFRALAGDAYITAYEQTASIIEDNIIDGGDYGAGIQVLGHTGVDKTIYIRRNFIRATEDGGAGRAPIMVGNDVEEVADWFDTYTGLIAANTVLGTNCRGTHGIAVMNQSGIPILWNKVVGYSFPAITKVQGLDLSNAPIMYNLSVMCESGLAAKGGINQVIGNNTVIQPGSKGIYISSNPFGESPTLNAILKNNILYEDGVAREYYNIWVDPDCSAVPDNNTIYSLNNSDSYVYEAVLTKAQWLALDLDLNSIFTNPNLNADYIPADPILIGENLGDTYKTGLDVSTDWGSESNVPEVVTRDQQTVGDWEVGAYVQR